jgi:glycerol uptake facilitator-like aquaporin
MSQHSPLLTEENSKFDESFESVEEIDKLAKHKAFVRAVYSEFMGTFLFFLPIFGGIANSFQSGWDPQFTTVALAMITAFNGIAIIFCFSSLSGAQFNPAISFGLWVVGKISNRRFIAFSIAQLCGALMVLLFIKGAFYHANSSMFDAIAVTAPDRTTLGNIFFTEFLMSFVLTFVAFAMAFEEQVSSQRASAVSLRAMQDDTLIMYSSTPQSKAGFAPFAIGFVLFGIVLFGGGSGVALNPVRVLAPAFVTNKWDKMYMYLLGEFAGGAFAAVLVTYGPQSGKRDINDLQESIREVPKEIRQRVKFLGQTITGSKK